MSSNAIIWSNKAKVYYILEENKIKQSAYFPILTEMKKVGHLIRYFLSKFQVSLHFAVTNLWFRTTLVPYQRLSARARCVISNLSPVSDNDKPPHWWARISDKFLERGRLSPESQTTLSSLSHVSKISHVFTPKHLALNSTLLWSRTKEPHKKIQILKSRAGK